MTRRQLGWRHRRLWSWSGRCCGLGCGSGFWGCSSGGGGAVVGGAASDNGAAACLGELRILLDEPAMEILDLQMV